MLVISSSQISCIVCYLRQRLELAGMWSRSRRLDLEAVLRPIKASASSLVEWWKPWSQSQNWGYCSWYWSWTVRPCAHAWLLL